MSINPTACPRVLPLAIINLRYLPMLRRRIWNAAAKQCSQISHANNHENYTLARGLDFEAQGGDDDPCHFHHGDQVPFPTTLYSHATLDGPFYPNCT